MLAIFLAFSRASPMPPAQIPQVTQTIDALLDAQSARVLGVMAVIVGCAVLVLLYALITIERNRAKTQQQNYDLLSKQIENNSEQVAQMSGLKTELAKQTRELRRGRSAQEDTALFQSRMTVSMEDNLKLTQERAIVHDVNSANILKIIAAQETDKAALLVILTEVITKLDAALAPDPTLSPEQVELVKTSLDLIITRLQLKPKDTPPLEPPATTTEVGDAAP